MDFTDIETLLSSEMAKDIKENTLKQQKEEEDYLLHIKNEKTKQDEIKQKQIETDIKQKELFNKTERDNEIKRNVDEAVNVLRKQLTNEHENVKRQLISDYERKMQNELNTLRTNYERKIQSLQSSISSLGSANSELEQFYKNKVLLSLEVKRCPGCGTNKNVNDDTLTSIYENMKQWTIDNINKYIN